MTQWDWDGEHPAEGTIHAWLDGAMDATESARMETHVASCASCASRIAEARGLIAGASRVVSMLDAKPAALIRPADTPTVGGDGSVWRALRVTPARAAIAAMLFVAVGIALTRKHIATEPEPAMVAVADPASPVASTQPQPAVVTNAPAPSAPSVRLPMHDSVLNSGVRRAIERDNPTRTIEPAASVAIPAVPVNGGAGASLGALNSNAVADVQEGRQARKAAAESTSSLKDATLAKTSASVANADRCYRIEAADGRPATWEGAPLPFDVALTSGVALVQNGETRRTVTAIGGGDAIGTWMQGQGDTLSVEFRGASATTAGVLAPTGSTLSGSLRATAVNGSSFAPAAPSAGASAQAQMRTLRVSTANTRAVVARAITCRR